LSAYPNLIVGQTSQVTTPQCSMGLRCTSRLRLTDTK
jgi:hypothetical protein